ncbi:MAG TPA: lamin tail domain-containing protein, partial [Candidatus Dormibacteraeota bacterium]
MDCSSWLHGSRGRSRRGGSTAGRRIGALGVAALAAGITGPLASPTTVQAVSSGVVISQVYGGGGNSGAPFQNDFVELFNLGASPVSLAGWSLQYASGTGTGTLGASASQLTELSGTLAPGQYLLVQEAGGAGNGVALPAPDVTDATPIVMSATAGRLALVDATTPLGCNGGSTPCPPAARATIVDLVGYGSADFFEGAPAPALSNTTAAVRGGSGCQETDSNAADFLAAAPAPRNTASPVHACGAMPTVIALRSPDAGAVAVPVGSNVTVTFNQPAVVSGDWYTIACASSGDHAAIATGGPTTYTLDPAVDLSPGEDCTVTVLATLVANMATNDSWTFTTAPAAARIHDIQGAGHLSPLRDLLVSGVPGTVTARRSNGFYLQDPNPDASDATSEGIFVFTAAAPAVAVGDSVLVGGRVTEYRPGGASSANLTTTEIESPTTTVLSSGNALPAPVVIGTGGRVPPTRVIDDDATGDVETSGTFDPATDGVDFYESMEGMRVQLDNAVAVGPTTSFGETAVVGDDGANASVRTARGGILLQRDDPNPERIIAANDIVRAAVVNVGDHFTAPLVGVLDYNFGNYLLELTSTPTAVHDGVTPETTQAQGPHQLAIGTFNVENLDPGDPATKFTRLAGLIVNKLRSPDILTVE